MTDLPDVLLEALRTVYGAAGPVYRDDALSILAYLIEAGWNPSGATDTPGANELLALARALPDIMTQEDCDAVAGPGEDPLDQPKEWWTTPRMLATEILLSLDATGWQLTRKEQR